MTWPLIGPLTWPLLVVAAGLAPYALALRARRARARPPWSRWRTASWCLGVALVALALAPPLADRAHDPRVHVAQHLLLGMYAPLALVAAAPLPLLLGALSTTAGRRLVGVLGSPPARVLTHPVVAAVLSVGGLAVLHLTSLHERAAHDPLLHHLVLLHFLVAGCLLTWALAGPGPAPHRPGPVTRLVVLVVAAGAHGWLAKVLYARADGDLASEAAARWLAYGGDGAELLLAAMLLAGWRVSSRRSSAPTVPAPRARTPAARP